MLEGLALLYHAQSTESIARIYLCAGTDDYLTGYENCDMIHAGDKNNLLTPIPSSPVITGTSTTTRPDCRPALLFAPKNERTPARLRLDGKSPSIYNTRYRIESHMVKGG